MVKLSLRWIQIKNPTQQVFALAVASARLRKELSKYGSYKYIKYVKFPILSSAVSVV